MFEVLRVEIDGLDHLALAARLQSIEMQERALAAEKALIVSAAERSVAYAVDGHASISAWVRTTTGRPAGDASAMVRLARLVHAIPDCGAALYTGRIGTPQAGELARLHRNPRCGDQLPDAIDLLLEHAATLPFDDFKLCARRWETLTDTDGAHRAREVTNEARQATMTELDGGLYFQATGGSTLVAVEMIEIFEQFRHAEFLADTDSVPSGNPLPRTDSQRRFDALVAIFRAAVTAPVDGVIPEPLINVVIDETTFEDHLAALATGNPLPARSAREIALRARCETIDGRLVNPEDVIAAALVGRVRRVVFDPAGVVISLGRSRRLFTGAARAAAQLTNHRCCYAGCLVNVQRCQIDHTQPWAAGGGTDPDNGGPLCPRHNRHKNRGYTVRRDPTGTWRTYRPDGTELTTPEPRRE